MDLQERLQAVQAEHQDITQQIAAADAGMAENQRAYEESQGNYYAARTNAQLQVRFLEGQMAAYSAMMQDQALRETQGDYPTPLIFDADEVADGPDANLEFDFDPASILNRAWGDASPPRIETPLSMLNGTQENSQPN